jgi:ABC-type nitrate/sulfonate/bicarbonate transport system substrate-binding protein
MLSYPDINEALRLGMHELVKMPDVKGTSFPMNVMVARRSFVEKNRDVVKRFQQAYAEGTYQFMTSREKGLAVLSKRLRFKNPKGLEETYDYFAKSFSMPPRVSQEGLRNTLEIIAQRNPAVKVDMNIGKYLDESIVDELEREGFFKRLTAKN